MNQKKVYDIIQYSLLVAGQEDDFVDRDLGPIHIIKYVYLADLAYAQYHNGETYTGIDWKFHNFGPWNYDLFECIESAAEEIGAERKVLESQYEGKGEYVRYSIGDYDLFEKKGFSLPLVISARLQQDIHKHKKETPGLLNYVYGTKPMASAAPGESLDFSVAIRNKPEKIEFSSKLENLSIKKQKKFFNSLKAIRQNREERKAKPTRGYIQSPVKPIYDEIYDKGIEWVESLAGEKIPKEEFEAFFSDEIWHSKSRKDEFPD
ncbi:MAG: hypothetical protein MI862_05470 [Desulfobacterales bacterium]|nr:hypothetical protein [Desulfobacterales bacterium]